MKRRIRTVTIPGSDIPEDREHYERCNCGLPIKRETGHDILCLKKISVERRGSRNPSIVRPTISRELVTHPTDEHREGFRRRIYLGTFVDPGLVCAPVNRESYETGAKKRSLESEGMFWPVSQASTETLPSKFARFRNFTFEGNPLFQKGKG